VRVVVVEHAGSMSGASRDLRACHLFAHTRHSRLLDPAAPWDGGIHSAGAVTTRAPLLRSVVVSAISASWLATQVRRATRRRLSGGYVASGDVGADVVEDPEREGQRRGSLYMFTAMPDNPGVLRVLR
jgi:hypothetical protein